MKTVILLACGVLLLIAGFTLKAESENWSLVLVPPEMHSGTQPAYTVDATAQKTYYSTGEELSLLGIVLIGVSAFRWKGRPNNEIDYSQRYMTEARKKRLEVRAD